MDFKFSLSRYSLQSSYSRQEMKVKRKKLRKCKLTADYAVL